MRGMRVRGSVRGTGGSMLIAYISPGQSRPEGFELDHEILTVLERSEGVWPLDVSTPAAYKVNIVIIITHY
jgi:hypothetical protein